jgi:large subunit ribosomal protein L15
MPLYRKLPHRGFNHYNFRTSYATINVGDLASLDAAISEVNAEVLGQAGLIRADGALLKILGNGEISRALKITATKFSESAKAKIEKAGGQAIVAE